MAYGLGSTDETTIAPFVFDAANEDGHSEGYVAALDNADGCLKLVYDLQRYGENTAYTRFSNVAYVYVCEDTEPGFKHTQALEAAYASSRYVDYIVSFRGAALGRELDFTLSQLEALVEYDTNGKPIPGGVGYSDFYSLANNAYWYVNEYEGLDLYKLLLYLGMEDAATMTVGAIEDLFYAENLAVNAQKAAAVKDIYQADAANTSATAIYEGVNFGYFLLETLGLPHEPASYSVHNSGGPLAVLLPSSDPYICDARSLMNVSSIK